MYLPTLDIGGDKIAKISFVAKKILKKIVSCLNYVTDMIKNWNFNLNSLVVLILLNIKFGHSQIIVLKI